MAVVDKTRTSESALEFIPVHHEFAVGDALLDRDVSTAWAAWSGAAEEALINSFSLAGGPIPPGGLVWRLL